MCVGISLLRRLTVPVDSLGEVLRNSLASVETITETALCGGIALIRRLAVPLDRLKFIPLNAQALIEADTNSVLRNDVPLLRRLTEPIESTPIVCRQAAESILCADTDEQLRHRNAGRCRVLPERDSLGG